MEKNLEYLQDKILECVFSCENDFYLTGGTALHKFYYNARYSDDLDFFVSNSNLFKEDIEQVLEKFEENNLIYSIEIKSRDFWRIKVEDIKIDFVNDRVYRYGKSNLFGRFRIDNVINIFTNKITAIIGRDEEKDIFDIFCVAYNENFNWKEILEIVNKKQFIEKDFLIYRLKTFPLIWLENIKKIKNIPITKKEINLMCEDIIFDRDNSLFGKFRC